MGNGVLVGFQPSTLSALLGSPSSTSTCSAKATPASRPAVREEEEVVVGRHSALDKIRAVGQRGHETGTRWPRGPRPVGTSLSLRPPGRSAACSCATVAPGPGRAAEASSARASRDSAHQRASSLSRPGRNPISQWRCVQREGDIPVLGGSGTSAGPGATQSLNLSMRDWVAQRERDIPALSGSGTSCRARQTIWQTSRPVSMPKGWAASHPSKSRLEGLKSRLEISPSSLRYDDMIP